MKWKTGERRYPETPLNSGGAGEIRTRHKARLLRGLTSNSSRRHMHDAWDEYGEVKVRMCPASQFVSVPSKPDADTRKTVCPNKFDMIGGPHVPVGRPAARCTSFGLWNLTNQEAILFEAVCALFRKQL